MRQRLFSLASPTGAAGIALAAGVAGFSGFLGSSCATLNSPRQRYWTDAFVLTPESLRMPYRRVSFSTADGIVLSGWWIPQTKRGEASTSAVLCCAPYNQDKSVLLGVARGLWDSGRSVLLFDFRSHAPNPTRQTIGSLELQDARAALNWLRDRTPENGRIALVGASMGGAMALTLAGEECERGVTDVTAVCTDCAFASLDGVVEFLVAERVWHALPPPVLAAVLTAICGWNRFFYGWDLRATGPAGAGAGLARVTCPALVVHSERDSVVPVEHAFQIYREISSERKELIVEPGLEHIGSFFNDESLYTARIVRFLDSVEEDNDEQRPMSDLPADS